jgi:hypothetical protein
MVIVTALTVTVQVTVCTAVHSTFFVTIIVIAQELGVNVTESM